MIGTWPSAGASTPTSSIRWDSSWPRSSAPGLRHEVLAFWEERFGVPPAAFAPFHLRSSSRTVYLCRRAVSIERIAPLRIQTCGLPFLRRVGRYWKPATAAAQAFGFLADRNVVDLDLPSLGLLARDGALQRALEEGGPIEDGYCLIRTGRHFWGCGLFLGPQTLLCRFPPQLRRPLADMADPEPLDRREGT